MCVKIHKIPLNFFYGQRFNEICKNTNALIFDFYFFILRKNMGILKILTGFNGWMKMKDIYDIKLTFFKV
jgi:hypothetical protein